MSRGLHRGPVSALVAGAAFAACSDSTAPSPCLVTLQTTMPGAPLTLLPDAQIARIGDGFMLYGADGDRVRWAPITGDGQVGPEASAPVPAGVEGPWVGFASAAAPADRVIVFFARAKAGDPAARTEVLSFTVGSDGKGIGAPQVLFDAGGGARAKVAVAVGSSPTGRRAAIAWGVSGTAPVQYALVGGDGLLPSPPVTLQDAGFFSCLSFVPTKTELGIGMFQKTAEGDDHPSQRIVSLRENGEIALDVVLPLNVASPRCASVAPTSAGYALGLENDESSWLGVFDQAKGIVNVSSLVGAAGWGGSGSQPPIGGLTGVGRQFLVVFERSSGPEVWLVDFFGGRQAPPLVLPAAAGRVGRFASWPSPGSLVGSYADYAAGSPEPDGGGDGGDASPASGRSGVRQFVQVECPGISTN